MKLLSGHVPFLFRLCRRLWQTLVLRGLTSTLMQRASSWKAEGEASAVAWSRRIFYSTLVCRTTTLLTALVSFCMNFAYLCIVLGSTGLVSISGTVSNATCGVNYVFCTQYCQLSRADYLALIAASCGDLLGTASASASLSLHCLCTRSLACSAPAGAAALRVARPPLRHGRHARPLRRRRRPPRPSPAHRVHVRRALSPSLPNRTDYLLESTNYLIADVRLDLSCAQRVARDPSVHGARVDRRHRARHFPVHVGGLSFQCARPGARRRRGPCGRRRRAGAVRLAVAAADQHDSGHLRVRRGKHSGRRGRCLPPDRDARPPTRRHHRPTSLECLTAAAAAAGETEPRRTTVSAAFISDRCRCRSTVEESTVILVGFTSTLSL